MTKDNGLAVVKAIEALMTEKGVNAATVADATGIERSSLSRILNGKVKSPRRATLAALAKYFGVSYDDLRTGAVNADYTELGALKTLPIELATDERLAKMALMSYDATGSFDDAYDATKSKWVQAPPDPDIESALSDDVAIIAYQAHGGAMAPIVCDGDLVYVRLFNREDWACQDGDIVLINGPRGGQIRRAVRGEQGSPFTPLSDYEWFVQATAPDWPDRQLTRIECADILGRVVGLYRKL